MDSLPAETLHQIFKLACTDGGYTGCSLALTSKSVREAARSTRFHSIAFAAETERLVALVTLYQGQCSIAADIRPRTSHLYLSFQKPVNASRANEFAEDEWDESEDEEPIPLSQGSSVPARFVVAHQLLDLVIDDLRTLVITKDFFTAVRSLFDRPLRELRELTLVRHADPAKLVPPGSSILPLFPLLTHLHIVAPEGSQPLFPSWVAHAPRVTHLRISAYDRIYWLLDELPGAVGSPAYPFRRGFRIGMTVGPPPAVRTYPSLAHVVVEPGPLPIAGACGTSRMAYSGRLWQLEWVATRARERGVEMYVPRPCARNEKEFDEAIRAEWLKRIGGEPSRDWFSVADEGDKEDVDEDEKAE